MMRPVIIASLAFFAMPLAAQDHSGHSMAPPTEIDAQPEPAMDHCTMGHLPPDQYPPNNDEAAGQDTGQAPMDHAAMGHASQTEALDKSLPGAAPENAVSARAFVGPRHAADSIWGAEAVVPSRHQLARSNGGMRTSMVMIERLEARIAADGGADGYVWDAQAFYGDDINRFVIKTEGEYDQRITQRLIIQPRFEVEISAQDIPEREVGTGITKIEPGVRFHYGFAREFAPYAGIEYEAKVGETADPPKMRPHYPPGRCNLHHGGKKR